MKILSFLALNWDSLLIVLALIGVLIVLYVRGEKRILNHILFAAVTEAEKQYKGGTGILKKAFVTAKIYSIIPAILKIILSEEQIGRWIEDALAYAKLKWAENAAIAEYVSGDASPEDAAEIDSSKPPGDFDVDYFGS